MKIILKQRIANLGGAGDIVSVKDGYARNFLFPQMLALEATRSNLKAAEAIKVSSEALQEKKKQAAMELAKRLQADSFTLNCQATEDDKLYGSIDGLEISRLLKEQGYDIDKSDISLAEPIKALGVYNADIKLHPQVNAAIKVWIVKK